MLQMLVTSRMDRFEGRNVKMSDRVRAVKKMPLLKDLVDKSPLLREVQFEEVKKSLIRKETLVLEPRADHVFYRLVARLDDPSRPWYITHV